MSAVQHHQQVLYLGYPVMLDAASWRAAKHGEAHVARFKSSSEHCPGMWESLQHPRDTPGFKLVSSFLYIRPTVHLSMLYMM